VSRGRAIPIDIIIARHRQGDTPEHIHEGFPTVSVSDVYAVIACYPVNQVELDHYLEQRNLERERIRREVEANYSPEVKARLEVMRKLAAQKRDENSF